MPWLTFDKRSLLTRWEWLVLRFRAWKRWWNDTPSAWFHPGRGYPRSKRVDPKVYERKRSFDMINCVHFVFVAFAQNRWSAWYDFTRVSAIYIGIMSLSEMLYSPYQSCVNINEYWDLQVICILQDLALPFTSDMYTSRPRFTILWNTFLDYEDEDGRFPSTRCPRMFR